MRKHCNNLSQILLCGFFLICWLVIGNVSCASQYVARTISYNALPDQMQRLLTSHQLTAQNFDSYLVSLRQQTEVRERDGEFEHLIYFALQSGRFTSLAKIEPALSAYEFVQSIQPDLRVKYLHEANYYPPSFSVPKNVLERFQKLLLALKKNPQDERQLYFKQLLARHHFDSETALPQLSSEYARVMKFLYHKEFLARGIQSPQQLADYVTQLYQTRGHSTDTQIEANFIVYEALAGYKAQHPAATIKNILIVGPGQDFAPRTDLLEGFEPQCYQPFAVADAILNLGFCDVSSLRIHCVDISPRVIKHLQNLPTKKKNSLVLLSGIAENQNRKIATDFRKYFQQIGQSIGTESELAIPAPAQKHLAKQLIIRNEIVQRITAQKLNIITDQIVNEAGFDLVIVTNVFPYFSEKEMALALANIAAMMKPGALLIHNESRRELLTFAGLLGLPSIESRTVLLAGFKETALYDGVVIHQKKQLN